MNLAASEREHNLINSHLGEYKANILIAKSEETFIPEAGMRARELFLKQCSHLSTEVKGL